MAVFSNTDLKSWRIQQKMSVADLAERISVDTSTIYKYESGKIKLNPDVMYECCVALGDPDVWTTWMRTEYPSSYGRMHPETTAYDLPGALLSMFAEMRDVEKLRTEAAKDGADGRIDDNDLAGRLLEDITELIRSSQRVKTLLSKDRGEGSK